LIIIMKYYRQPTALLTAIVVLTTEHSFTNGINSVKDGNVVSKTVLFIISRFIRYHGLLLRKLQLNYFINSDKIESKIA
jgi:hypothetical protein